MLRPESLATEASRVSRADADGAGGTDASPAPFAFRRVAITPPDGFPLCRLRLFRPLLGIGAQPFGGRGPGAIGPQPFIGRGPQTPSGGMQGDRR